MIRVSQLTLTLLSPTNLFHKIMFPRDKRRWTWPIQLYKNGWK